MDRGLIQEQIEKLLHQIEVMAREIEEREVAGQRKVAKLCKEQSDMLNALQRQIDRHRKIAADLTQWLEVHDEEEESNRMRISQGTV